MAVVSMSEQQNAAIVHRIVEEVFNRGNLDLIDGYIDPKFHDHSPRLGQAPGVAGFKEGLSLLRQAFPDLHYAIEDTIATGDKVVIRARISGTHRGKLRGAVPTGKRFEMTGIAIARLADGKLVERWACFDNLAMLQQLGLLPGGDHPRS
jgi:predicted ester cyclase